MVKTLTQPTVGRARPVSGHFLPSPRRWRDRATGGALFGKAGVSTFAACPTGAVDTMGNFGDDTAPCSITRHTRHLGTRST